MYRGSVIYQNVELIEFIYEENENYKYDYEKKLSPEFRYIPRTYDGKNNIKEIDLLTELGGLENKDMAFYLSVRLRATFKILSDEYDESLEEYIIDRFIKADVMRRSLTIASNVLVKTNRFNAHHILSLE